MKSLKDFYSVRAAAKAIGIKYMALHKRINRGTVEVARPGTRIVLVPKSEVERLIREVRGESC